MTHYQQDWQKRHPDRWRQIHDRANAKYQRDRHDKALASRTRWHRRMRGELMAFLGGRCVTCGFDNPLALHVDHINDDGHLEGRNRYLGKVFKLMKTDRDEVRRRYQILCANCNEIKRMSVYRKPEEEDD
jgi:hypothetical protein